MTSGTPDKDDGSGSVKEGGCGSGGPLEVLCQASIAVIALAQVRAERPIVKLSDVPARVGDRVAIIQHPGGMVKQVALHHAGGDLNVPGTKQMTYRNQGIAIARIRDRMAALGVTV